MAETVPSRLLHTIALATLCLFVVALPFETRKLWLNLGPIRLTFVDVTLCAFLVVWACGRFIGRWRIWTRCHTLVALYAALVLLSALIAPVYRPESIHFALRMLGGCLLFFGVADIAFSPRYGGFVAGSLSLGAMISAIVIWMERWAPAASSSEAMPLSGLSGTFANAGAAAMYWEATLPVFLCWTALVADRYRKSYWLAVAGTLLLVEAIVLTGNMVGLIVAALCILGLLVGNFNRGGPARTASLAGLGVFVLLVVIHAATDRQFMMRLSGFDETTVYRTTSLPEPAKPATVVAPDLPAEPGDLGSPVRPSRIELWRAAIEMWREHPMLGVGPDNFRHLYGSYLDLHEFDEGIHAGNLYLEMLATQGLLGSLLFMLVVLLVGRSLYMAWRIQANPVGNLLVSGFALALAAYLVHGFVDYFLAFTPTHGLFWVSLGVVVSLTRMRHAG